MEDLICFGIGSVISWALTSAIWSKRKQSVQAEKRCASPQDITFTGGRIDVSSQRCNGIADPRCNGGCCTAHCRHACAGKCLE